MRRGRKLISGAVVLLFAIALVFSSMAIANTQIKQSNLETNTSHEGSGIGARGAIVWDNGMQYGGLGASQEDTQYPLSFMCADDFMFDVPTEVCDVHWVGGYWNDDVNYNLVHWPWMITFYYDDGTGERPGQIYLGPFVFDDTQYTEVLLEDNPPPDASIYYEFSVDLLENYLFPPDEKFWIVIQGVGFFPPQSGWGLHQDPITLHEAVFKGELLGFPDWTDTYDVFGYSADMCFQLTTKEEAIPAICCDPGIMTWSEIVPGSTVTGTFHVWNCGDDGSTLNWKVDTYPAWMSGAVFTPDSGSIVAPGAGTDVTFTFTAPTNQNQNFAGDVKVINEDDPSDYCEMSASLATPRMRGVHNTFFLRILEQFPNAFPLLRYIMGI